MGRGPCQAWEAASAPGCRSPLSLPCPAGTGLPQVEKGDRGDHGARAWQQVGAGRRPLALSREASVRSSGNDEQMGVGDRFSGGRRAAEPPVGQALALNLPSGHEGGQGREPCEGKEDSSSRPVSGPMRLGGTLGSLMASCRGSIQQSIHPDLLVQGLLAGASDSSRADSLSSGSPHVLQAMSEECLICKTERGGESRVRTRSTAPALSRCSAKISRRYLLFQPTRKSPGSGLGR